MTRTAVAASTNGTRAARFGGYDAAFGLAMSPDGTKVSVTGDSQGSTADFATVAYSVP